MTIATHKVIPSGSVICADLNDEAVLLNVETGIYFGLDALGAEIWRDIDDGFSESEIASRLLAEYDVSAEQLQHDLLDFLAQLEAHGLIERASA